jgi:hypothetical protein
MTIQWLNQLDFDMAIRRSRERGQPVLVDFHSPTCSGCQSLEAETYSDPLVIRALTDHVIPLRVVTTEPDAASRRIITHYISISTPSVQLLSPQRTVDHYWRGAPRFTRPSLGYQAVFPETSGHLTPDRFLAQLLLGRGKSALKRGRLDEAIRLLGDVIIQYPNDEAATEEAGRWAAMACPPEPVGDGDRMAVAE